MDAYKQRSSEGWPKTHPRSWWDGTDLLDVDEVRKRQTNKIIVRKAWKEAVLSCSCVQRNKLELSENQGCKTTHLLHIRYEAGLLLNANKYGWICCSSICFLSCLPPFTDNSSATATLIIRAWASLCWERSTQTPLRSSTDNFDHNEARRENNWDKSPSSRHFEVSVGRLCVRGKWEKAGFCVKKEKRADTAFDTWEGAALSGSYQQSFSACYLLAIYIDSKCYFSFSRNFRSFFGDIQQKMIVIAGLPRCFLQLCQTMVFHVLR